MFTYELFGRQMAWPANWDDLFGREAPLLLEIGFGGGHFLLDLAYKRPLANIIGLDISLPANYRAEKKIRQAGLTNVRLMQNSAQFVLWLLCTPQSISEVFINFPDPWPKSGHQHRRLINVLFLHLLATRMGVGGKLNIATDHAGYATQISACLEQTPYFVSQRPTPFVTEDSERLQTKYEQLALNDGRTCHYYFWQRNNTAAPNPFTIPQETTMPHLILQTPLTIQEIESQFQAQDYAEGGVRVRFTAVFLAQNRHTLLVETFVAEDPLNQRIAILIRDRGRGEILLGLHEFGFPRPTPGVQKALALLAKWLETVNPKTIIRHHNLADNSL
ncbi:MAG: tRNA (guanosine(46)-N7)-methyltransferase TrmB [Chloroflexi bacterium]|nr:tRNA (guanosine(46)-N7)-methyltransferase TrmB [Chloroflexota bacterium]